MCRAFGIVPSQASHLCQFPGRPNALGALPRGSRPSWSFCRMRSRMAPRPLGGAPFEIPGPKTVDVEVDRWCLAPPSPLHKHVLFRQEYVAGVTGLPVARTAPDYREPVMGQATVTKLARDDET